MVIVSNHITDGVYWPQWRYNGRTHKREVHYQLTAIKCLHITGIGARRMAMCD